MLAFWIMVCLVGVPYSGAINALALLESLLDEPSYGKSGYEYDFPPEPYPSTYTQPEKSYSQSSYSQMSYAPAGSYVPAPAPTYAPPSYSPAPSYVPAPSYDPAPAPMYAPPAYAPAPPAYAPAPPAYAPAPPAYAPAPPSYAPAPPAYPPAPPAYAPAPPAYAPSPPSYAPAPPSYAPAPPAYPPAPPAYAPAPPAYAPAPPAYAPAPPAYAPAPPAYAPAPPAYAPAPPAYASAPPAYAPAPPPHAPASPSYAPPPQMQGYGQREQSKGYGKPKRRMKKERIYVPVVVKRKKKKMKIISIQKGFFIAGGTQLFGKYKSLKSCQKACAATPNCFAGDYNPWLYKCYIHSNFTACGTLRSHKKLIHFKKVPCDFPEAPTGRVILGVQVFKGIEQKGIKSLSDCLKKCASAGGGVPATSDDIRDQICFGIDYNFGNHKCYFHVNNAAPENHFCPADGTEPGVPRDTVPNPSVITILLCPGPP